MLKTKTTPSIKDLRVFSLILFIGFMVIGWIIPALNKRPMNPYLVSVAAIIFVLGVFAPKILVKPREYWIVLGNILGKMNSTILFTIIYFLVFTTVGFVFRIFGRDRMHTQFRAVKSTMVVKKEISPFTEPF